MKCEDAIISIPFQSVSFGSMALRIYTSDELQQAQLGYSVDQDGNSLVGDEEGAWKENWFVIGYEDLCGDPIFVDVLAKDCPVYTAMHGIGRWEPTLIASTIEGFSKALEIISALTKGRENPVELEKNPLPDKERDEAIQKIKGSNSRADMDFWQQWLGL